MEHEKEKERKDRVKAQKDLQEAKRYKEEAKQYYEKGQKEYRKAEKILSEVKKQEEKNKMSETLNIVLNSASFCAAMLLYLQVVQKILKCIESSFGFSLPIGRSAKTAILVVFILAWVVLCGREKTGKLIYNKKILAFGNIMTILSVPSFVLITLAGWYESDFKEWIILIGALAGLCIICLILLFYNPKRKNN